MLIGGWSSTVIHNEDMLSLGRTRAQYRVSRPRMGVPQHDDRVLFEFLILEGAQAGLAGPPFSSKDKTTFLGGCTLQNAWQSMAQVPARRPEADRMSKDLLRRGFKFVGPTICYALMQAVGLVNDHLISCFRYRDLRTHGNPRHAFPPRNRAAAPPGVIPWKRHPENCQPEELFRFCAAFGPPNRMALRPAAKLNVNPFTSRTASSRSPSYRFPWARTLT
jgi:methyladenine glycosylase